MNGLIGQSLGGYRITAQIGRGGMATVYKAYQPSLDRYVAVKVLPPYYAEQDPSFLKRFEREAKAIASLRHPNILIVMDHGEQDGTTYIVMEYVESGTLSDLMGKPLPPAQMARLVEQVAGALDYAHQAGVVHRDIKPSNILLPKPDWPLLTDFGLAKIVGGDKLTQSGTIAGTPAYMSPEQGRGEPVDARSDIYSLGIVLYEMATGVVPFEAETPMAVVVKHIIDPLPLPSSKNPKLPESIERVILKALAKERGDRFQKAGELASALNEAVAGLPSAEARAAAVEPAQSTTTLMPSAEEPQPPAASDAEPAAAPTPAPVEVVGAIAEPKLGAGAPAAEQPRRLPNPRRIAVGGVALVAVALLAFGAWRLLGSRPAAVPGSDLSTAPPSAGQQVDGRTVDQLIADASSHVDAGNTELALQELGRALNRITQDAGQLLEVAQLQLAMGDPGTVDTVERARGAEPDQAWVHETAGDIYQQLGDLPQAEAAYRQAIELDPGGLWAYLSLAETQLTMNQPQAAADTTQRAMEAGAAQDPDLLESFGWMYLDHGFPDHAEPIFAALMEAHPGDLRGASGLAEMRYQNGDVRGAIEVLQRAVESTPDSSAFESLGWWYWEVGELDAAQASFEQSIALDPAGAASSYGGLASLLADRGQPDQAEELLRRAVEDFPDQPDLYAQLAGFLVDMGRPTEALDPFSRAVELEPGNPYRYVDLARAHTALGNQDPAMEALQRAAELAAGDPWAHEAIGWGYADLRRCDLAVEHFNRALELDSSIESAGEGLRSCGA